MNAWSFIGAAYALTVGATTALAIASYLSMRRAEAAAAKITRS